MYDKPDSGPKEAAQKAPKETSIQSVNAKTHISKQKHVPMRQCVSCRARDPQSQLLRVALVNGQPAIDPKRRLAGRGAYLHRRMTCLDRAVKRGSIFRALGISNDRARASELRQHMAAFIESQALFDKVDHGIQSGSAHRVDNRGGHGLTWLELQAVVGTPQPKDQ